MTGTVSVEDRGFTLGDGVFDTALAINGTMLARDRHVARLLDAARSIGIGVERDVVETTIDATLTPEPLIIRTTVTRGTATRGLWPAEVGAPTIVATRAAWSPALLGQPMRLITAGAPRNERSPTAGIKALGYLDHILAAREAAQRGADDALVLNTIGRVACTTIANLFVLKDGMLLTPPLTEGCLPGVIRALVLEIAPALGFEVREAALQPAELHDADAVFATNSVRLIRRVVALDGAALSEAGAPHVAALQRALNEHLELPARFSDP